MLLIGCLVTSARVILGIQAQYKEIGPFRYGEMSAAGAWPNASLFLSSPAVVPDPLVLPKASVTAWHTGAAQSELVQCSKQMQGNREQQEASILCQAIHVDPVSAWNVGLGADGLVLFSLATFATFVSFRTHHGGHRIASLPLNLQSGTVSKPGQSWKTEKRAKLWWGRDGPC